MSEGKQYIPDQFAGREFKTASVTQAKVATKLYKTSSSDPAATDDTGLGYAVGTIWTNTTSGQVFICTDATAENSTWRGQEGDDVNLPTISGSTYAIVAQGGSSAAPPYGSEDSIYTWAMDSPFSINDWGEISPSGPTVAIQQAATGSMRTPTTAFIAGGNDGTQSTPTRVDTIKSFNLASPSSATDVGEMASTQSDAATGCDLTYGAIAGGRNASNTQLDTIETMTLSASPGNSTDGGAELARAVDHTTGASNVGGGSMYVLGGNPLSAATVEKFNVQLSPDTVTDWAELTAANARFSACSDNTNLFACGGYNDPDDASKNIIDQWTFSTGSAATDWGDLAYSTRDSVSHSGVTYMWTSGGVAPPNTMTREVDRFSASSAGNAADQGDMTTDKAFHYGTEV